MSYRVCIPTAGTGSRLGDLTRFINKSLVSVANRPTLSHLIEQFPDDVEFVIATGHKGHLVREFLELAYPKRKFFFCEVDPFEGPRSGLGLSLLTCKQYLQQPFVFTSCDTLVKESIPSPDRNWLGYSEVEDLEPYRTLKVASGRVQGIFEKGEGEQPTHKPYIGLAGIHDFDVFWQAMESDRELSIRTGEVHGLRDLSDSEARSFTWFDTGNAGSLAKSREVYQEPDSPNILEKVNEAIWFVDGQVIKFSDDKKFIANRIKRVQELSDFVPQVTGSTQHMYRYGKVEGRVFSELATLPLFERLLEHSKMFWLPHKLDEDARMAFRETCMNFYRDKTLSRIDLFYKNFDRKDGSQTINGTPMPTLSTLMESVDWNWLADGLPGRFHGDFHFENILWSPADERFTFLDWRQDFGENISTGDIYYDFAKLLHGLIINHEIIAHDLFTVNWGDEQITYDFHRKQSLVECEQRFCTWLEEEGYDRKKTWILTAMVYLNIAALHHYPYSLLLYALGKTMLFQELEK